jgi:signal transduction histidine kinase/DNA-binding NarL/FixJ family response regulator
MSMRQPLRILSVEDDLKDTDLIQDLLETEGIVCEITRVDTEAALLASVEQGGIDLILADYTLPSFDGISALKFAMKACPDVPFIFVSGTLGEEVAIEALKIGATDYVLKTRLSRLVPSVLRALREATQRAERKRAEESLRQSEAYLAEAQRLSHTGSFGWRPSTGEILWSEETLRIFQYDRATKPTAELVLQRVHPDDAALVKQTIEQASRDGKDFEHEYRLVMPDSSVKYVHVMAHASDESDGVEFVGAVMDISDRKRADEERERLRQVQADLAHLTRVTTMGELTASLAHEIRQPISAAVTNAKTCMRWLGRDEPDVAEACEAASRLVKDVTRAADIIGRISSLYKKGTLQRELVDVNELIGEMIVLLRSEANRYSISIGTELAEDLPKVMADRVQLQQVLMNLMLNGIDAMKETRGRGELTIRSEAGDAQLLISVSDTGVGLPAEQAEQIFKAFFTTKDNGTGMGLPISRSIIESHGGRLWATDAPASGATFQFTLPATVAAHA